MNGLKILTGYVIICVSFMYTVLRAEMSSQRRAQDPMTMRKCRLESWLGDYMQFRQTADGKNVFLSVMK